MAHTVKLVPITPGDLTDHQQGTDDILTSVDFSTNILIGDAGGSMFDFSRGGNDTFTTGDSSDDTFYGDAAGGMFDFAQGGDDSFTEFFFARSVTAYGDAGGDMSGDSKG